MINPNFNKDLADALKEFNKKTNAYRIRAMSDEELAKWIVKASWTSCPTHRPHRGMDCINIDCSDCWLEWLQTENTSK